MLLLHDMEIFKKYIELRNEIDQLSEKLSALHNNHMQCKKGCDMCCMDYGILPIEFQYIKSQLQNDQWYNSSATEEECIFLKDHLCQIYEHRPIICRTHGLPLLFMNADTEEWELSACELNFVGFEDFGTENTIPMDKFNSRLFMLNEEFIQQDSTNSNGRFDLISVRDLVE